MSVKEFFEQNSNNRLMFLHQAGWHEAQIVPVGEDSSSRRYFRLNKTTFGDEAQSAILMESVPDGHRLSTQGHRTKDYERIAKYLSAQQVRVPQIYSCDHKKGFILLEDFGDLSFRLAQHEADRPADAMGDQIADVTSNPTTGLSRGDLYKLATDNLIHMGGLTVRSMPPLPAYYGSHVHEGRRRLVDWYVPTLRKEVVASGTIKDYLRAWDDIEKSLPPPPMGFVHVDYQCDNLMLLSGAAGLERCGLLDFQGAMYGPLAYDLANLLEDARVEIPKALREEMLAYYCRDMSNQDAEHFALWYRILATQFHCRVIGQFIKLAIVFDKPRYLEHIPRLCGYISDALQHPVLEPLCSWISHEDIVFDPEIDIVIEDIKPYIRGDAF